MLPLDCLSKAHGKIVGLDPGTTMLGVSVLEFTADTFELVGIRPFTLNGNKLPSNAWTGLVHGARSQRIESLEYHLLEVLAQEEPLGIASEHPFFNVRRPNAYGALMEILCALRSAVKAHSDRKPLYLVDPPTVKRAIGAPGNADKDAVKAKMLAHPELGPHLVFHGAELDEHCLDATAVAYSLLCRYRSGEIPPLFEQK
jgi:Holliday junction resolvasome RuvABC endonuclease subunit